MGETRIHFQRRTLHKLRRQRSRRDDRNDLIILAMKNEGRHVELLEVLSEVRFGESLDAVVAGLYSSHHALEPPLLPDAFRYLCARPVVAVERKSDVLVKLWPILYIRGSQAVEHLDGGTRGILVGLHHERRHGADEHGHGNTLGTVTANITRHLPTAGGVADMDCVLQVELFREFGEIIGVGIHIVAVPGLSGATMAPPVVR